MNRRNLIKLLSLVTLCASPLLATAPAISAAPVALGNSVNKTKELRVGDKLRHDGKGLTVTFVAVKNDNRCPIEARCISAGDAEVVLRVKAGNQKARLVSLHTNDKPRYVVIPAELLGEGTAGIPKSYVIRLKSLNPLRHVGKKIRQKDYRLTLKLTTAL